MLSYKINKQSFTMKLSVIVSVYNEEKVLRLFYNEIINILNGFDYELIFVNDGSTDQSQTIIEEFFLQNKDVKSISFSRNFGHEAAMIAGIDYATGRVIVCMDSDLQHPPEMILQMLQCYMSKGVDIINMVKTNVHKRGFSVLFYKLINKISPYQLEPNASDFFLISERIANILRNDYRERVRFLRGFIQILGFKKTSIRYEVAKRQAGESKYPLSKLISLSIAAVTTLSRKPLKISIYMGFIFGFLGFMLAIYSIIMKIVQQPVSGYTTIIVFISIVSSVQFIILGIIGQYVGFLFEEQKQRPIYIVDKTNNF